MQPNPINGKALMMSSVGSKELKTSKTVRLFDFIFKIFTLKVLRNSNRNT